MPDPNYRINFTEEHGQEGETMRAELVATILPHDWKIAMCVEGEVGTDFDDRLELGREILARMARDRRDQLDVAAERV